MKFKVEQVTEETEESVSVYCHDPREDWVNKVQEAALGQCMLFALIAVLSLFVYHSENELT